MKNLKLMAAALLAVLSTQAAAVGGLADINVYDRSQGRQLQVYWHQGRAYVVGNPGNEYQVTLRNRQGEDVLAVLSVDGVNAISGQTATPQQSGYVLSPRGALEVKGWRKDTSRTAAFYFTELSDSYAARTGRPDNVGAIGVALFRRKAPEYLPYVPPAQVAPQPFSRSERDDRSPARSAPMEKSASAGASADSLSAPRSMEAPLGTGHGRSEASPVRMVGFERATSEPVETVVIYYDSYRNLVARGIIPQPSFRPQPNPFPGFVQDPPA